MNLRRLAKILFASFLGQGVTVVTQLIIPPFFLRYYSSGVAAYGEWLALSASVNYIGMLNYGIQNYANNEMTIRYNAGDTPGAKRIQAGALRLLLGLIAICALTGIAVFFLPVADWLKLHQVTPAGAQLALYLLILQLSVYMLFTLLSNGFMMVGRVHRGGNWASGQRLFTTVCMAVAIFLRASFPVLAAIQLGSLLLFSMLVLFDIHYNTPVLIPRLRDGSWRDIIPILRPSGHFGVISLAGFLTWQLPIVLIQRFLGAEATGAFGLVRAVFQMSRQILMIASSTLAQDITEMWGRRDWRQLRKLYDLSERVVLFLIPLVTVGTLLLSPLLFTVWLHKRGLYEPTFCFLMALISGVQGIKEHKTQFQSSSNEHETLSLIMVFGYSIMLAVAVPMMIFFGLTGYLVIWLVWEIIQTGIILRLNERLFPPDFRVTFKPILKLCAVMIVAFTASIYPAFLEEKLPIPSGVALAIGVSIVLAAAAYRVFGLREIVRVFQGRLRNRLLVTP